MSLNSLALSSSLSLLMTKEEEPECSPNAKEVEKDEEQLVMLSLSMPMLELSNNVGHENLLDVLELSSVVSRESLEVEKAMALRLTTLRASMSRPMGFSQ